MKFNFKNSLLGFIACVPLLATGVFYDKFPATIPTHFGLHGPDAWGNKSQLFVLPGLMAPAIFLFLFFIPHLDPKRRVEQMGEKWFNLKFILVSFFTVIGIYILQQTYTNGKDMGSFLMVIMGALFASLGNYFQTIRPNYFIGLRTPWTLENEQVWKDTHRLAGRMWLIGGICIMPLYFVQNQTLQMALFIAAVAVLTVVPTVYSYLRYKAFKRTL